MLLQTQKKEVLSDHGKYTREGKKIDRKYTKETRERNRKKNQWYRDEINSGFNLLMKWVPGTETLIRAEILKKTVDYIKKLQKEINEKESLKESKKRENYIKELQKKIKELEKESTSQKVIDTDCSDSAQREPHSSPTNISEEADFIPVKTFTSTPTGASLRKTSCVMDAAVQTTSEAESDILSIEEELLGSPEGMELLVSPEEEMELLASGEELPELNWMGDLRQWLEL
jgi:hypothetical protein